MGARGTLVQAIEHAAFSADGARILTTSTDQTAKLWDAASGKLIASFEHETFVEHGAFSPDGARILTACWDPTAKLWDATSSKLIASLADPEFIRVVYGAFSPDGAGS